MDVAIGVMPQNGLSSSLTCEDVYVALLISVWLQGYFSTGKGEQRGLDLLPSRERLKLQFRYNFGHVRGAGRNSRGDDGQVSIATGDNRS